MYNPYPGKANIAAAEELPYNESDIGTGDNAIYKTVQQMRKIIMESSKNPVVREWARYILDGVQVNNKTNEATAIHNFVRDNVRYTKDPYGWEYIQTPPVLLEGIRDYMNGNAPRPIGDCDDMTTLDLSLMRSIGFPVTIKVIGFGPYFSHVYGMVYIKGKWVVTDTVRPDKYLGWEAPGIVRSMEVPVY